MDGSTSVDKLTSRHCAASAPRVFLGFCGEANRIAADQQVRRKAVAGRQTEHNLSHLDGIADLFTPIRFQSLGNSADRRLILREEFGRVLVRASAPVCPHPAGFKAQTFTPNGDSSWARDSVKPPTAHFAAW